MLRHNKISPKKPCPFCGAFLEKEQLPEMAAVFCCRNCKIMTFTIID